MLRRGNPKKQQKAPVRIPGPSVFRVPYLRWTMKRPPEIALDVRRERIREAARTIRAKGGRPTAARIARLAGVDVNLVVALAPTFGPEGIAGEPEPERELAAAA